MKVDVFTTRHIIRIVFKGLKEAQDFFVEEDEWERFKTRLHFCTTGNTLEVLEQIDESFVCINVQNVANVYFLLEPAGRKYEVPSDREDNENWSIKMHFLNEEKPASVFISDHEEMGELYMRISDEQTDMEMQAANRFLGFTDGKGELFMFSRSEVLYLMIPRLLFAAGAGEKRAKKGQ